MKTGLIQRLWVGLAQTNLEGDPSLRLKNGSAQDDAISSDRDFRERSYS